MKQTILSQHFGEQKKGSALTSLKPSNLKRKTEIEFPSSSTVLNNLLKNEEKILNEKRRLSNKIALNEKSVYPNNLNKIRGKNTLEVNTEVNINFKKEKEEEGIPNISPEVLKIIQNSMQPKRREEKKESSAHIKKIDFTLSLKEKYGNLISEDSTPPEYRLGKELKFLMELFCELDRAIEFMQMRKQPTFLNALLEYLKTTSSNYLSMHRFRQIMKIYPSCYHMRWEKNLNQKNKLDLFISFSNDENSVLPNLFMRRNNFKKNLIAILEEKHHNHLKKVNLLPFEEDFKTTQTWESSFNIDEIEIEEGYIPEKPINMEIPIISLADFLQNNEIKNNELKNIFLSTVYKYKNKVTDRKENEDSEQTAKKIGLSDKLINLIKRKEENLKTTEKTDYQKNHVISSKTLLNLADRVKTYFSIRNVSNAFFCNVLEFLEKSDKTYNENIQELKEKIIFLSKLIPTWIEIRTHTQGEVLRIDKNQNFAEIIEKIEMQKEYLI